MDFLILMTTNGDRDGFVSDVGDGCVFIFCRAVKRMIWMWKFNPKECPFLKNSRWLSKHWDGGITIPYKENSSITRAKTDNETKNMGEQAFALAPIVGLKLPVVEKKKRSLPRTLDSKPALLPYLQ